MSTIIDAGDTTARVAADLAPIFAAWNEQLERAPGSAPVVELRSPAIWPRRLLVVAEADLPRVAAALARGAVGRS